jgi:predicted TIM-barrel fold metal-dependent hydrolase
VGTGPLGNEYVGYHNFIQVMKRYPDLHVNVAHMGGLEYQHFMDLLTEYKNLYLDTSFTFFKSEDSGFNVPFEQLEKNQGRLLYGSDFPNLILPREEELEKLLELGFSQEFYQKLFYDNGMVLIQRHSTA